MSKKAIIAAGFGSSHTQAWEKAILPIENEIMLAIPDYDFQRSFLSQKIINILQSRKGMQVENTSQVLERLVQSAYDEVLIQPLLVIKGIEYENLLAKAARYADKFSSIRIGSPLLTEQDDFEKITETIRTIGKETKTDAVLFMGHGSEHPANQAYAKIKTELDKRQLNQIYIATVEGSPTIEDLIPLLKEKGINSITLMPFMLVAGDHAKNDMAGDEEDSWKSLLEKEGFRVEINLRGMGEWQIVQQIFAAHAVAAEKKKA